MVVVVGVWKETAAKRSTHIRLGLSPLDSGYDGVRISVAFQSFERTVCYNFGVHYPPRGVL